VEFATRRFVERVSARGAGWTRATLTKALTDAYAPIPAEPAHDTVLTIGGHLFAFVTFEATGWKEAGWGMVGHNKLMQWRELVEFARTQEAEITVVCIVPAEPPA
jgi:hypothetical protein